MKNVSLFSSFATLGSITLLGLTLSACNTPPKMPEPSSNTVPKTAEPTPVGPRTEGSVTITPYPDHGIKRKPIQVEPPSTQTPKVETEEKVEKAPAYHELIARTKDAYVKQQWDEAEKYALQTQRISPQSPENYYYLSRIATHKKNYSSAEAFARRGLSYAKTAQMKKLLWSSIAEIGRAQKNSALTLNAQKEILKLN